MRCSSLMRTCIFWHFRSFRLPCGPCTGITRPGFSVEVVWPSCWLQPDKVPGGHADSSGTPPPPPAQNAHLAWCQGLARPAWAAVLQTFQRGGGRQALRQLATRPCILGGGSRTRVHTSGARPSRPATCIVSARPGRPRPRVCSRVSGPPPSGAVHPGAERPPPQCPTTCCGACGGLPVGGGYNAATEGARGVFAPARAAVAPGGALFGPYRCGGGGRHDQGPRRRISVRLPPGLALPKHGGVVQ